jgi:hypothetical protein
MAVQRQRSWWTWNLGRVAGIQIRVHVTLLLLLAWIVVAFALQGAGARASVSAVALVLCVFVIIVAHELGHALVARQFGIRTRDQRCRSVASPVWSARPSGPLRSSRSHS